MGVSQQIENKQTGPAWPARARFQAGRRQSGYNAPWEVQRTQAPQSMAIAGMLCTCRFANANFAMPPSRGPGLSRQRPSGVRMRAHATERGEPAISRPANPHLRLLPCVPFAFTHPAHAIRVTRALLNPGDTMSCLCQGPLCFLGHRSQKVG